MKDVFLKKKDLHFKTFFYLKQIGSPKCSTRKVTYNNDIDIDFFFLYNISRSASHIATVIFYKKNVRRRSMSRLSRIIYLIFIINYILFVKEKKLNVNNNSNNKDLNNDISVINTLSS